MIEDEHNYQRTLDSYIFSSTYMFSSGQKYDISYQLGAYYDIRYKGYFTRPRIILGLSKYTEDDTIHEREEEILKSMSTIPCRKCKSRLDVQRVRLKSKTGDVDLYDYDEFTTGETIYLYPEFEGYIQDPFERVLDELFVGTYPDIDEQELWICKGIVYVNWGRGLDKVSYKDLVSDIVHTHREDLFPTIKDIESTIQRLILKAILFQSISYCGIKYKRNLKKLHVITEPHIVLALEQKVIDEAYNSMMDVNDEENAISINRLLKYGLRDDRSYGIDKSM
jgi:hypothetical protein